MLKIITTLVCFLSLIACSSHKYRSPEIQVQSFDETNSSIAILKFVNKQKKMFGGHSEHKVSFNLVKLDENLLSPDNGIIYKIKAYKLSDILHLDKSIYYLMLEPGTYLIKDIAWYYGETTYESSQPCLKKISFTPNAIQGIVTYGGFKIKPNSVAYVGDLIVDYNYKNKSLNIEHTDNFEAAVSSFREKYPKINKSVERIHYLPSGKSIEAPLSKNPSAQEISNFLKYISNSNSYWF